MQYPYGALSNSKINLIKRETRETVTNLSIEEREDVYGSQDQGEEKLLAASVTGRGALKYNPARHYYPVYSTQRSLI